MFVCGAAEVYEEVVGPSGLPLVVPAFDPIIFTDDTPRATLIH